MITLYNNNNNIVDFKNFFTILKWASRLPCVKTLLNVVQRRQLEKRILTNWCFPQMYSSRMDEAVPAIHSKPPTTDNEFDLCWDNVQEMRQGGVPHNTGGRRRVTSDILHHLTIRPPQPHPERWIGARHGKSDKYTEINYVQSYHLCILSINLSLATRRFFRGSWVSRR